MTGYGSFKNLLISTTALAAFLTIASVDAQALVISSGNVTASEVSGLVPPPSTVDPTIDGAVRIGDTAAGQVDVTAGSTLQVNEFSGLVTGADGGPFSGARIHVGDQGQGTLDLSGGSTVNVSAVSSADGGGISVSNIPGNTTGGPSSAGSVQVNDSTINVSALNNAFFNVGRDGSGTALFENGSTLSVTSTGPNFNASISVGQFAHGAAPASTLTLDGAGTTATINTNQNGLLFVGDEATGTMVVRNGASVQMNGVRDNIIQVGDNVGGNGNLQINSGGTVTGRLAIIGDDTGSVGAATVDGTGSRFDLVGKDTVDGARAALVVGDEGTATMNVTNGGKVEVNGAPEPGRASVINVGGSINSATSNGDGTLNVDGAGSEVRLSSDGIALFQVGRTGAGALNVTNGGSVIVVDPDKLGQFRIGRTGSANGTVTVDGAGSTIDAGRSTRVGIAGSGALNIQNGGVFTSTEFGASSASSGIGTGTVNVTGAGSRLDLLGVDGQGDAAVMLVGINGTATVNVNSGGTVNIDTNGETVTNLNGGLLVGGTSTSTGPANGALNVDGAGSSVNVVHSNASMQIGRRGTGALNITNGATVTNAAGDALSVIGRTTGSVGTVNVTGAGSQWQAGSDLFLGTDVNFGTRTAIGNGGTGTLNVANGGSVIAGEIVNAAGGTITGGGGTITGNIANAGGTIAAGNSPGLLTVAGNVDLLGGGTMEIELGGTVFDSGIPQFDYDRIDVSDDAGTTGTTEGDVTIDAGAIFDIDFFGAFTAALGDTFDVIVADDITSVSLTSLIFDFTGAALATGLDWDVGIVSFGSGREALQLMVVAQQTAVSEPSIIVVFGLGLAGMMFARRKRSA